MDLFDYIKCLFSQSSEYENLPDYVKKKHTFMVTRFFSIQYPIQAQLFNKLNIDPIGVSHSWRKIGIRYKKTPGWIFTKTTKNTVKKSAYTPSEEAVSLYLKINEIGMREYKDAMLFNLDKITLDLKQIQKNIDSGKS